MVKATAPKLMYVRFKVSSVQSSMDAQSTPVLPPHLHPELCGLSLPPRLLLASWHPSPHPCLPNAWPTLLPKLSLCIFFLHCFFLLFFFFLLFLPAPALTHAGSLTQSCSYEAYGQASVPLACNSTEKSVNSHCPPVLDISWVHTRQEQPWQVPAPLQGCSARIRVGIHRSATWLQQISAEGWQTAPSSPGQTSHQAA